MKWYIASLYTFGSGIALVIVLLILAGVLNLIKIVGSKPENRFKKRGNIFFALLTYALGAVTFVLWTAIVIEFAQSIEGGSKFLKHLAVFIPFVIFEGSYVKGNVEYSQRVKQGEYGYEVITILMNGAGLALIAFVVFYIWPELNNQLFGGLPSQIVEFFK